MPLRVEERGDGELAIHADRARLALLLALSIAFAGLGAALVSLGWPERELVLLIAGALGLLFFGACALWIAARLLRQRPLLVLTREGLHDQASAIGVGLLRWSEIEGVRSYDFRGQRMLGIQPRDLEAVLARASPAKALAMRANLALGCAPINIPAVALPGGCDELAELLRTRFGVRVGRE